MLKDYGAVCLAISIAGAVYLIINEWLAYQLWYDWFYSSRGYFTIDEYDNLW